MLIRISLLIIASRSFCFGCPADKIQLPEPDYDDGMTLIGVIIQRRSVRAFSDDDFAWVINLDPGETPLMPVVRPEN